MPEAAIAQRPPTERGASRMLLLRGAELEDRTVADLLGQLRGGDCVVVNDTRVRAARLQGRLRGHPAELLLVRDAGAGRYLALVRPARRLPPGAELKGEGWSARVLERWAAHPGGRLVELESAEEAALDSLGEIPLPPYIHERLADPERYQTVYATGAGVSAAAPTAGLHLTEELLDRLSGMGVELARVQLEVGIGTFAPIRSSTIEEHQMHSERFQIPAEAAKAIGRARSSGCRVVAVGTTVVRCLESGADGRGGVNPGSGETGLFITSPSDFRVVDGLLTNFHQPRSSLLVLVSAFYGMSRVRAAYRHALASGYRFLSFGDCMFGWRSESGARPSEP